MKQKLTFAVIGCGSRGRTYMEIARILGHEVVAFADPREEARDAMREFTAGQDQAPREYDSAESLLAARPSADVAVIATQDARHLEDASGALEAGYDILLEKPAAQTAEEVEKLGKLAAKKDRRIVLCFVLRYTPFYRAIKSAVDAGKIGKVMSIQATEGVGPWHHSHSYVRGHWSRSDESTPMIVAKSCHDTDIIHWLAGAPCEKVSSYQHTSHFIPEMAPEGATPRCTDGCPQVGTCRYDAHRYLGDQRKWMEKIRPDSEAWGEEEMLDWLRTSPWGRCAYHCDQDTPDHQVVSMQFANEITAGFTMTAFDTGRRIRIYGTEGILEGAIHADGREPWVECRAHEGDTESIPVEEMGSGGYQSHGGGDYGLIAALPELLERKGGGESDFLEGHRIAFAAAKAALGEG